MKQKLEEVVSRHSWQVAERQEYTYEELLNDLPNSIDYLKQNIEDGTFDILVFSVRNNFLTIITQINSLLTNIYANHQQFPQLMDQTQALMQQVRIYRLDFEARRIPRYKEKIREYRELIDNLNEVNDALDTIKTKQAALDTTLASAKKIIEEIEELKIEAEEIDNNITSRLENVNTMNNQVNVLLETVRENRENIIELVQEAKVSTQSVKELENNISKFHDLIDENRSNMHKFIEESEIQVLNLRDQSAKTVMEIKIKTENQVHEHEIKTDEIINKNIEQQSEISKQLKKAVGASLFSTFDIRKIELNKNLNKWLIAIIVITSMLVGLSGWVAYDIIKAEVALYVLLVKIGISFPLVYALAFVSSRYTKERRLVEEYAFKSTISLALSPYADLVKKIEEEGSDGKYRDFLIGSIENIFSAPTDKAFGYNKHGTTSNHTKTVDEVLSMLEKVKNISKTD